MKGLCIFFVGTLFALAFAAQAPESRGNDFMVAFAYNYQNGLGQTQTLYISSDQATTVVVATKTTTVSTVNVPAGGTVSVNVNAYYVTTLNSIQNVGVRVYSTDGKLFTLVGLNTYTATSDAFLAFPVNVLGTNYMTAGYTACCSTAAYLYVVAPQDGTSVTIAGTRTLDGGGTTRTYSLASFQVVAVGITNGDITGFTVNSNKPVAVFSGAACANIPTNVVACNTLVDQVPPTNTWDTDFITVPIATRLAGDVFRVVSNKTGTVVTVNGANVATLAFGAWYEFQSSVPNVIHTSEPALVMQFDKGSSADSVTSDPFQIWIPPVNQFAANYYISTPTGSYWSSWVNIVVKSGAQSGILYDGVAITGVTWSAISGSSYVYARKQVVGGGSHWVSHTSPIEQFEVIVYGFGSYDGFGYVGGNRLSPLQDPCTTTTTVAGDGIDNDCDGRVDEEIRNGIDDDNDGLIDEDLAVDTCCYTNTANPVFTPASLSSQTIYCGDSIPAAQSVSVHVVCSGTSDFTVTPTVTTSGGSCPNQNTITRTYSVTDDCGRTKTLTQTITILPPAQTCGNGVVEGTEQCDGGACCSSSCTFASSSSVCRASNGPCDAAETCSGSSASCPADSFQSSSTVCRASNGPCDVAESCSGSSASCPADSFQSSSTVCRSSNGVCDVAETCTGSSASCPADSFQSSSTVCRSSNGVCDVAETCTGSSASCPADSFQSSSTVCRASNGVCDVAESCSGSSASCPSDSFQSSSTVCRASAGDCDVAESCTGSDASCPSDSFQSSTTVCRASAGICDVEESCTGSSASCPSNSFQSSSTVCRASAGVCDVAESCTGSGASCPADSVQPSSFVCRASVGPCDETETCTGSDVTCPDDSNGSFETACPGLSLMDTAFTFYDVIAFGDFNANTGDVEQRLAVGGNFNVGNGWSIGEKINGDDGHLVYSLVVNGNGNFGSGRVMDERVFVGGSFSEASEWNGVAALVDHCPGNVAGCLTSQFEAAKLCYSGYQNSLATPADNTAHIVQWSGLYVTCDSPSSSVYYLSLTPSEMTGYTWTSVDSSCNSNAKWIINVRGTGDVPINGGSFPVPASHVTYNILGSGRTVNIGPTQVEGSILAPFNNVNQPNGVILGKVIANNILSLQINKHQCFNPVAPS